MNYVHKCVGDRWESIPVRSPADQAARLASGWSLEMPALAPPPAPVADVIAEAVAPIAVSVERRRRSAAGHGRMSPR